MSKKLRRQKRIGVIKKPLCDFLKPPEGILTIENKLSRDDIELFIEKWNSSIDKQDISKIIPIKSAKKYYFSKDKAVKSAKKYADKYMKTYRFVKRCSKIKIGYSSFQKDNLNESIFSK
jgi:hypothetical protein